MKERKVPDFNSVHLFYNADTEIKRGWEGAKTGTELHLEQGLNSHAKDF